MAESEKSRSLNAEACRESLQFFRERSATTYGNGSGFHAIQLHPQSPELSLLFSVYSFLVSDHRKELPVAQARLPCGQRYGIHSTLKLLHRMPAVDSSALQLDRYDPRRGIFRDEQIVAARTVTQPRYAIAIEVDHDSVPRHTAQFECAAPLLAFRRETDRVDMLLHMLDEAGHPSELCCCRLWMRAPSL